MPGHVAEIARVEGLGMRLSDRYRRCQNDHDAISVYGTGSRVILTVAHLDHQPENCADDNLKAMCQGCHLHYDRDHHRETARATRETAALAAGATELEGLDVR